MTPEERIHDALEDLVEYCDAASQLVAGGRESFLNEQMAQLASEALLNRIGDTAQRRLTDEFRAAHPEIDWSSIIATRVRVAHIYQRLDYSIVWSVLVDDLPYLRAQLRALLDENGS